MVDYRHKELDLARCMGCGTHLEPIDVLALWNNGLTSDTELVGDADSRQTIHPYFTLIVNVYELVLTGASAQARLAVRMEEAVKTGAYIRSIKQMATWGEVTELHTEDKNIVGVLYSQCP